MFDIPINKTIILIIMNPSSKKIPKSPFTKVKILNKIANCFGAEFRELSLILGWASGMLFKRFHTKRLFISTSFNVGNFFQRHLINKDAIKKRSKN